MAGSLADFHPLIEHAAAEMVRQQFRPVPCFGDLPGRQAIYDRLCAMPDDEVLELSRRGHEVDCQERYLFALAVVCRTAGVGVPTAEKVIAALGEGGWLRGRDD